MPRVNLEIAKFWRSAPARRACERRSTKHRQSAVSLLELVHHHLVEIKANPTTSKKRFPREKPKPKPWFVLSVAGKWPNPELRHRHRSLTLAAMMISKFHGPVKTVGAVAVVCSDEAV